MIFISLLLIAIFLYVRGNKVLALLTFFFFLTSGFNLIPEEVLDLGIGISKGYDYAFFILLGMITIDAIFVRGFFKQDTFVRYLILFFAFLFCCVLYSKYSVGLSWSEIIRTSRYHFFWMAYFIFRHMEASQLERLTKYLFLVTVILSSLYLLQIIFDTTILLEKEQSSAEFLGITIPRYYNHPDMLNFFVMFAIYANPYSGPKKYISIVILILALCGAFHRSLTGFFFMSIIIGFIIQQSRIRRIRILTVGAALLIFVALYAGNRFTESRTYIDLRTVMSGDVADADIDITELQNSTFTFRIGHLFERIEYLTENPEARIFGAGLIPEDSKMVDKLFDFQIGLLEELTDSTIQLETSDISYSVLFIRLGYVGTFFNLLLFIYLMVFFYKKRENKYALSSFLFLVLSIGISFFSGNLLMPVTFILPLISYNIVRKTEPNTLEIENTTDE